MYTVHCRIIVDNKCGFYHSSSQIAPFDTKPNRGRIHKNQKRHVCQLILVHTIQCVYTQTGPDTASVSSLQLSSSRIRGLQKLSPSGTVSQCANFCVGPCPCFASCNCCHDPFSVRNAQTCPSFIGFLSEHIRLNAHDQH